MTTSAPILPRVTDRAFYVFAGVLSAVAIAFLGYLLLLRGGDHRAGSLSFMPAVNASLNGLAAVLITSGYVSIRRRRPDLHKYFMVSAFFASTLFLLGYVAYHFVHGDTHYPGTGAIRAVYLIMLASHVALSAVALPLTLVSFFFAFRRSFTKHRKVVKYTLPIWLYVSVTGVLIFVMLRAAGAT